jgi:hypothetical protein
VRGPVRSRGTIRSAAVVATLISTMLPAAAPTPVAAAGDFIVDTTADAVESDDFLSLREALMVANGTYRGPFSEAEQLRLAGCDFDVDGSIIGGCGKGGDTIRFDVTRIDLEGRLPAIVMPAVSVLGKNGSPRVDGRLMAKVGSAFTIDADDVRISGISIVNGPPDDGTIPFSDIDVAGGTGIAITNDYLGTLLPSADVVDCAPKYDGLQVTRNATNGITIHAGVTGSASDHSVRIRGNTIGCHPGAGVAVNGATFVDIGVLPDGRAGRNLIGRNAAGIPIPNGNGIIASNALSVYVGVNAIIVNTDIGILVR